MGIPLSNLPPGFRFHPTDEELIVHYLRKKVASLPLPVSIIAEVDIYKFDPWDLPGKATFGEKEWYFFSPRDRKYPNGARPNRAAASGYWKATGTDKSIGVPKSIGVKKALVFYKGRPPKGIKTNWIMHEYRLVDNNKPIKLKDTSMRLDDWVLCRIYRKSKYDMSSSSSPSSIAEASLLGSDQQDQAEEQLFLPTTSSIIVNPHPPPQNTLISHKSLSFSNLLDAMDYSMLSNFLSENHSNIPPGFGSSAANSGFVDHQSSSNNVTNPPSALSVPNMENIRPKRQISHIDQDTLYPSKKYLISSCNFPETNNQCEINTQWNFLLKQSSLLNQQLLLGPHLRFQG